MKELKNKIAQSIKSKLPFVVYRKPNIAEVTTVFQTDSSTNYCNAFLENGFVFAPFDDTQKTLFIPSSKAEESFFQFKKRENTSNPKIQLLDSEIGKEFHINLVQKGIDYINTSDAKKIVLSRKEKLIAQNFDVFEVFQKLLENYPSAFVYLWFHPKTGLWLGATPERLLAIENQKFKVMALASTQVYDGTLDVVWGNKELQEHQFVVDYIAHNLKDYKLEVSKTYTVKAGSLLHLRADISGTIKDANFSLSDLVKSLHPTPATCGLPKQLAKEFILKNENYNREYYTGFLGEISNLSTDLYVNLRCMKVERNTNEVSLFIGGGITKDSNPQNEWKETVAKTNVMKKVV